jgi:hypothetical protein
MARCTPRFYINIFPTVREFVPPFRVKEGKAKRGEAVARKTATGKP